MSSKRSCEIKVDGEAEILLPPERAILKIKVYTTSIDKPESTARTIDSARKVEAHLRELSEKLTHAPTQKFPDMDYWSRTSLTETSNTPYRNGKHEAEEYTATINFRLQVVNFSRLGSLIHDMVSIPHVASQGVDWILTPATQKAQHSTLRQRAAENAVAKARDYASALGYRNVYPLELVGSKQRTMTSGLKGGMMRWEEGKESVVTQASNMADSGILGQDWEDVAEAFQYTPEEVKMTQTVNATFIAE